METDKFEKHIKAQFKEREINPSANAWEKISSELSANTVKKKQPMYLLMGIAASIAVLVGIALFYFNGKVEFNNTPLEVVEKNEDKQKDIRLEKEIMPLNESTEQVAVGVDETDSQFDEASSDTKSNEKSISPQMDVPLQDKIEVAILDTKESNNAIKELKPSDKIINDKVAELVAQVEVLEQNSTVTDAEVDSLLKRAQQEILQEKIFNTNKSVDAMALLTEVEDELDQSFRDQIFNSLKAGFIKVRTAVADRNN